MGSRRTALSVSVLVGLLTASAAVLAVQRPAHACVIQIVEFPEVLDVLTGNPSPEMGDVRIVGVVQMRVFREWPPTDTNRAASAAAPKLIWGEAPDQTTVTHGGQPSSPSTTTDCPTTENARPVGRTWWLAVFEQDAQPNRSILISRGGAAVTAIEQTERQIRDESFGEPQAVDSPVLSDAHPSEPPVSTTLAGAGATSSTTSRAVAPEVLPGDSANSSDGWLAATVVVAAAGTAAAGLYWRTRRRHPDGEVA